MSGLRASIVADVHGGKWYGRLPALGRIVEVRLPVYSRDQFDALTIECLSADEHEPCEHNDARSGCGDAARYHVEYGGGSELLCLDHTRSHVGEAVSR